MSDDAPADTGQVTAAAATAEALAATTATGRGPTPPTASETDHQVQWLAFDQRALRKTVVTILLVLVVFAIGMWVFRSTASFLFLLLLAWLFGVALEPIVGWLARRGMKRGLATGIAMIVFLVLGIIFLATFGSLLVTQLAQLIESLPHLIDRAADWASRVLNKEIDPTAVAKQFNITNAQVANWASNVAGGVLGVLSTTVGLVFQLFTMALFAFYFSADGPRLRRTIASWLPTNRQQVFATVWTSRCRRPAPSSSPDCCWR